MQFEGIVSVGVGASCGVLEEEGGEAGSGLGVGRGERGEGEGCEVNLDGEDELGEEVDERAASAGEEAGTGCDGVLVCWTGRLARRENYSCHSAERCV